MPLFDRMSLRLRILTLACIPLLALVAGVASTATIRGGADGAAAQAERSAKASHLARDLGAAAQVINLEARAMLLDGRIDAGESLRTRVADLTQGLDRLAQSPDIGKDAAALKSEAALVSQRLNTVIAMHAAIFDKDGAAATVTALGASMEQFLQQALSRYDGAEIYQITIAILRMRRAGQQFATSKTPAPITEFQENAAALANALPGAQMTPNDIRTLRALSADYLAAFQRWVDASRDLDQYDLQLTQASQTLTADLARLAALANVNEQAAQQRAEEARGFAHRLEIWLIAIAVALTAAAALLLTRSISSALNGVRQSMAQIKNGDQSVAIAGLDRKDEIGEMARACGVSRSRRRAAVRRQRPDRPRATAGRIVR